MFSRALTQLQTPNIAFQQVLLTPWRVPTGLAAAAGFSSTPAAAAAAKHLPWWQPPLLHRALKRWQRGQANFPTTPLEAGAVSPRRPVPPHIARPYYATVNAVPGSSSRSSSSGPGLSKQPEIMSDKASRDAMRAVGRLAAQALRLAGSMAVPGTSTDAIDAAVHDFLTQHGAYPSPLLYCGFPKSICTSVNEVVCHGIPDSRSLQDGDVLNVDVTAYLGGFHGDCNASFFIGQPSAAAEELLQVTAASLQAAIDVCGPGVPFRAIGDAISSVADAAGMYIIHHFVGHGIGRQFHAAPPVLHYRNLRPGRMLPWQTFTIEPSLALGTSRHRSWPKDPTGWTAVTRDGSLTAQFEHTVMVTDDGVEVLTQCN